MLSCVQLFATLWTVCSPPGSSVHGILHTRILEWVAISSSRGSSQPRDQKCDSCVSCIAGGFFTAEPWGKPICTYISPLFYFLDFLPIQVTKEHRGEFSVLYSSFPLVICLFFCFFVLYLVVYLCQSQSFKSSLPFHPLVSIRLFSIPVSLFLLCK